MRPSFLLDGMLGRLCRKMRMLGCDCELIGGGRSPWLLLDAEKAGRIAVTTATRSLDRRGPPPVILRRASAPERIAELFAAISGMSDHGTKRPAILQVALKKYE